MPDDLPRLTNEDDWLDLRDGDAALLVARLDHASLNGLLFSFPDWSCLAVELEGITDAATVAPMIYNRVELEVIRTEDGLKTNHELLRKAKIYEGLGSSH